MTKQTIRFYNSEPVIEIDKIHYNVNPLPIDIDSLEVDECYCFNEIAAVYRGEIKDRTELIKPGLYVLAGTLITFIPDEFKEEYSSSRVKEFNVDNIIDEIVNNTDEFVNPEDLEVIQNNAALTVPVIRETDDFLTKIVKRVIISKKINLKNYEHKIDKSLFTNMKLSLNTESRKMSVMYFRRWAEVLGFDYSMLVTDDGTDNIAPLKEEITFDSTVEIEGED